MSINKQQLLDMLGSPKDISDKDLEELEDAVRQYPYFQLGYSLISKAKYDRQTPDAYDSLSLAAIHAPDRGILKKIFYDNLHIDYKPAVADEAITMEDTPEEEVSQPAEPYIPEEAVAPSTTEVAEEEQEDAEEEVASEENENSIEAGQPVADETETRESTDKIQITELQQEEPPISVEKKEEDEEVYRELEENLKNLRKNKIKFEDEEEDAETSDKKKTIKDTDPPQNQEFNTISGTSDLSSNATRESDKNTREKGTSRLLTEISALAPLPAEQIKVKQQTQFSLIDKFISTQPEIVFKDQSSLDIKPSDLSEKSTLARDPLLTENYAAIMLKQGRIDKAIEIYRKLIWKFPQKKAYFAAKVNALKERE